MGALSLNLKTTAANQLNALIIKSMRLPSTSRIKVNTSQIRTDYESIVWLSGSARRELTSCLQLQTNLTYCLADLGALSPAAAKTMLTLHPVLVIEHDSNFFPIAGIRSAQVGMHHLKRFEAQLITGMDEQAMVALAQSDAYLTPCLISLDSRSAAQQFAALHSHTPQELRRMLSPGMHSRSSYAAALRISRNRFYDI